MRLSYALRWVLGLAGLFLLLSDLWVAAGTSWVAGQAQEQLRDRFDDSAMRPLTRVHTSGDATAPPPVQFLDPPRPEPGAPVAILRIATLDLETVVVEGSGFEELRIGVGHDGGTSLPGEGGNTAIVGHPSLFGGPFRHIGLLDIGDRVEVETRWGVFEYAVLETTSANPDDRSFLEPTASPTLTLVTWEPSFGDQARLVVRAALVSGPSELPVFAAPAPRQAPDDPAPPEIPPGSLPRLTAVQLSRGPDRPATQATQEVVTSAEPAPAQAVPQEGTEEAPSPVDQPAPDDDPTGGVGSGYGGGSPEQPGFPFAQPGDDSPEESPEPDASAEPDATPEPDELPEPKPVDRSKPACSDGLDNDGDGLIDYRALDGSRQDRNCNGADDDDE